MKPDNHTQRLSQELKSYFAQAIDKLVVMPRSGYDEVGVLTSAGLLALFESSREIPSGEVRQWCSDNGIPVVDHPLGSMFFVAPGTEDEAFHVRVRWH